MHNLVLKSVKYYLKQLDGEVLFFNNQKLKILDEIKKIPRSGKSTRIDLYKLNLPKRSLYDHIMALAYQSDILLFDNNFDVDKLARIIVFHDVAEIIIGDIPQFTNSEIAGELYKTEQKKIEEEYLANNIIMQSLNKNLSELFRESIYELENKKNLIYKLFTLIDKVDPIISIWRYIYLNKQLLEINTFIYAMSDFFENPNVIKTSINEDTKILINFLQSKNNARQYYIQGNSFLYNLNVKKLNIQKIIDMIEKRQMHFI